MVAVPGEVFFVKRIGGLLIFRKIVGYGRKDKSE